MRNDHIWMSIHKSSQNCMATSWIAKKYKKILMLSMTCCGKIGLLSSLTLSCDLTAILTGIVDGLGLVVSES